MNVRPPIRVLSLGAGVQSTALLLMSLRGELPRLDHCIFADTRAEPPAVYRHLEWLRSECERAGLPLHTVSVGNLRADAIAFRRQRYSVDPTTGRKGYASIPLFVLNRDGSQGRIRRQCTAEYKIAPIERFIRRELLGIAPGRPAPKRIAVEQWLGISADELRRARPPSGKRRDGVAQPVWWKTHTFPLVSLVKWWGMSDGGLYGRPVPIPLSAPWQWSDGRYMDRGDCVAWLRANYPDLAVPRSACVECPYRSDAEWAAMKRDDPESFAIACASDDAFRQADAEGQHSRGVLIGLPFVHRSMRPLRNVDFDASNPPAGPLPEQDENGDVLFGQAAGVECEGMCGV